MQNNFRLPKIFFYIAAVCAVLVAAGTVTVMVTDFDWTTWLFKRYETPTMFLLAAAVAVLFQLIAIPLLRKTELPRHIGTADKFTAFFGGMTGCLMLGFSLMRLYHCMTGSYAYTDRYEMFGFFAAVLAVPGAIYFIIVSVSSKAPGHAVTLLGDFAFLALAAKLVDTYFDMNSPLNSPPRIIEQLMLVALLNWLICELKFIAETAVPPRYVACTGASLIMVGMSAVPRLVLTAMGYYVINEETLFAGACVMMAMYIVGRYSLFLKSEPEPIPPKPEKKKKGDADNADA